MKFRMLTVFLIALCMVLAACNSGSPSSSSNGSAGAKESDQSSEEKRNPQLMAP